MKAYNTNWVRGGGNPKSVLWPEPLSTLDLGGGFLSALEAVVGLAVGFG